MPSQFHELPADKREVIEGCDGHATLRNALRAIAVMKGEWAGIPMPLEGERLVVEPSYPHAEGLMKMGQAEEEGEVVGSQIRNSFFSGIKGRDVIVFNEPDGRIGWGTTTTVNSGPFLLATLGCCDAWGIEQESNAVHLLGQLVTHRQFKQYMLTGMFLEQSKRSRAFYLFRRLRPTLAISTSDGTSKILAALCMHPIAYYAGSWAGAMCPTDDVIAHLQLMRGDEPMFWRRANQHPAWRPEAGL